MPNDDYILRDGAIDALTVSALLRNLDSDENGTAHGYRRAAERIIAGVPAADVEPVRHGRWIPHPGRHDFDLCSVCGTGTRRRIYEDGGEIEYNYKACPWCRAKMDDEQPKEFIV